MSSFIYQHQSLVLKLLYLKHFNAVPIFARHPTLPPLSQVLICIPPVYNLTMHLVNKSRRRQSPQLLTLPHSRGPIGPFYCALNILPATIAIMKSAPLFISDAVYFLSPLSRAIKYPVLSALHIPRRPLIKIVKVAGEAINCSENIAGLIFYLYSYHYTTYNLPVERKRKRNEVESRTLLYL